MFQMNLKIGSRKLRHPIMGLRKLPFVFTEQGVSMLKSQTAVQTSIQIIKSFVGMLHFLQE